MPSFNPIRIEKRLKLNKETVSRLQTEQMMNIVGGQSSYTCPATYSCPASDTCQCTATCSCP